MKNTKLEESHVYEFCKVCKINHNQGRRHNFFPRHANSLSSLLSRFATKLSAVKSALKHPALVGSSQDTRFWCIFCEAGVDELGSSFTSENVLKHLASEEHLKELKHFMWKYGGGMNKVDSFRVTEAEVAKWKKGCEVLQSEAASSSGIHHGSLHGQSNDIRPNYEILNSFEKNSIPFLESSLSNHVMPLQYDTNENYQVYASDISKAGKGGPFLHSNSLPMAQGSQHGLHTWSTACMGQSNQHHIPSGTNGHVGAGVHNIQIMANRELATKGYQNLTRISSGKSEDCHGNVHTGAPPPWLEGIETHGGNVKQTPTSVDDNRKKKPGKLNPKRVGAAWAEKRKRELEMEKRGEIIADDCNADWLPNFGRVWQSGSRKESMKEFKKEKQIVPKAELQAKAEIELNPYVSKRMRRDTNGFSSEAIKEMAISPK